VLRHFAPLLAREGRVEVALLSARVGSIADNRLGGWYGYRASKAALNQLVRTPRSSLPGAGPAVVVALHPGTVDTAMSRPFQANVAASAVHPRALGRVPPDVLDRLTRRTAAASSTGRAKPIPF
jgi:NAD(P)-dependent dehydrogenase (short-subunit alcohol dehydrogenase family)